MSDQPAPVPAPDPAPDPVVDPVPTAEGSQVIDANYVEHVLDSPYFGWAFNGLARINLSGQRIFTLHDDGTPVQYGTPPDLT